MGSLRVRSPTSNGFIGRERVHYLSEQYSLVISSRVDDGEWTSQQVIVCQRGCNAVSWCSFQPNTKESRSVLQLAVAAGDTFVYILKCVGSPSNPWEIETKLSGHTDPVRDVAWSPFIGITSNVIASCGRVGLGGGSEWLGPPANHLETEERRDLGQHLQLPLHRHDLASELVCHGKRSGRLPRHEHGGHVEGELGPFLEKDSFHVIGRVIHHSFLFVMCNERR